MYTITPPFPLVCPASTASPKPNYFCFTDFKRNYCSHFSRKDPVKDNVRSSVNNIMPVGVAGVGGSGTPAKLVGVVGDKEAARPGHKVKIKIWFQCN